MFSDILSNFELFSDGTSDLEAGPDAFARTRGAGGCTTSDIKVPIGRGCVAVTHILFERGDSLLTRLLEELTPSGDCRFNGFADFRGGECGAGAATDCEGAEDFPTCVEVDGAGLLI